MKIYKEFPKTIFYLKFSICDIWDFQGITLKMSGRFVYRKKNEKY